MSSVQGDSPLPTLSNRGGPGGSAGSMLDFGPLDGPLASMSERRPGSKGSTRSRPGSRERRRAGSRASSRGSDSGRPGSREGRPGSRGSDGSERKAAGSRSGSRPGSRESRGSRGGGGSRPSSRERAGGGSRPTSRGSDGGDGSRRSRRQLSGEAKDARASSPTFAGQGSRGSRREQSSQSKQEQSSQRVRTSNTSRSRRSRAPTPATKEAFFGAAGRQQFFELFSSIHTTDTSEAEAPDSARHIYLAATAHTAETRKLVVLVEDGASGRIEVDVDRFGLVADLLLAAKTALGLQVTGRTD